MQFTWSAYIRTYIMKYDVLIDSFKKLSIFNQEKNGLSR